MNNATKPIKQPTYIKTLAFIVAVSLAGFLIGYSVYALFSMNKPTGNSVSRSMVPTPAPRSTMQLSPNVIGVAKNESFTIDIVLDAQNSTINGADSVIMFDPQYFAIDKITTADKMKPANTSWLAFSKLDKELGKVVITTFKKEVDNLPTTTLTIAQLTIKPLKSGTATMTLEHFPGKTIGSTIIRASDNENILDKVIGSTITIL